MKLPLKVAVVTLTAAAVLFAMQETVIQAEARQFGERAQAQGFQCRTELHQASGKAFEARFTMNKDILYYLAVVTGRGEKVAHVKSLTLVNHEKRVVRLDVQSTVFGSEVQLRPFITGEKTLKFELDKKSDYSLVVCANYASLYHTGEKDKMIDDHSHF